MIDSMMDMSITTIVVIGLVVIGVLAVVLYVALRVGGGRAQSTGDQPSPGRSRRNAEKRAKLR